MNAVTVDPLAEIREDYARLEAHYRMVYDAGNRELREAQRKSALAHEYFDEAQRIQEQMQTLERFIARESA